MKWQQLELVFDAREPAMAPAVERPMEAATRVLKSGRMVTWLTKRRAPFL